jgi:hypothetical protein
MNKERKVRYKRYLLRHIDIEKKLKQDIRSYSEDKRKKYEKIRSAEDYNSIALKSA